MKIFHSIVVSVFIKPEEDYALLKEKFISLFPFNLEENKIMIKETNASTFYERTIKILEVELKKESLINQLMKKIRSQLSEQDKKMIINQLDSRIDDDMNFFFRLSKKQMIYDNKFCVVDHGKCYHFKCHVVSYPRNKEKAKKILSDFFSEKSEI